MLLVTGATGFLGSHTIPKLVEAYDGKVRFYVRETSDISLLEKLPNIEFSYGSFEEINTFEQALEGVDTLINIASLGFGHGPSIVDACKKKNVRRTIFISTTAMFTQLNASTKIIRQAAEKSIIDSGLNYTILRPTMIYGTDKDRNMNRLIKMLNKVPLFPIFGNGEYLQQPIHVDDLADAIIKSFQSEKSQFNAYNLSGADEVTFNQVIDTTSKLLNKKVKKLHIPVKPVMSGLKVYEKLSKNPILKGEQVLRLNEHKNFEHSKAVNDFNFTTRTFKKGIKDEIELMRDKGLL